MATATPSLIAHLSSLLSWSSSRGLSALSRQERTWVSCCSQSIETTRRRKSYHTDCILNSSNKYALSDNFRRPWSQRSFFPSDGIHCRAQLSRQHDVHRFLSFQRTKGRSPYAVLELNKTDGIVTKGDIRAAFRRLAKVYHPDVNPHKDKVDCESSMTELVEAYQILMEDDEDFAARFKVGHSSKVALVCELYSLDELTMDRFHDVYALEMVFEDPDIGKTSMRGVTTNDSQDKFDGTSSSISSQSVVVLDASKHKLKVYAHPQDSVSDLKRCLEEDYGVEWGLRSLDDDSLDRRKDRDGLATGWELLVLRATNENTDEPPKTGGEQQNKGTSDSLETINEVLSYHLFLDDYEIRHGETIYAVVRKHGI